MATVGVKVLIGLKSAMKVAGCSTALNPLRTVPIMTMLLWRHAVDGVSTESRELQQIE